MANRWNYSAAFLASGLFLLAACSSGGGGAPSTVSAPVPVAPVGAQEGLLSFQASNTTVAYPAASATALVTNSGVGGVTNAASGQGATITVTTGGGAIKVAFDVPTTGATFTQQFVSSVWDYDGLISGGTPSPAGLAGWLKGLFGSPNTSGALLTQFIGAQSLNYAAYGLWASGDTATTGRAGAIAFGNQTPTASVPATGSATFNGSTMGVGGATSGSTIYALKGNAQIIADFSAHTVTTNLTNLATQNISTNAVGSLPDLTGKSSISGNAYAGPVAGTGLTGTINGNFYGSAGQETAGVWQASGGGNSWIGSYGAK